MAVMSEQFEHELARSIQRIEDAVAPYTRFVRDQQAKLTQVESDLNEVQGELRALRYRIGDPEAATPRSLPSGRYDATNREPEALPAPETTAIAPGPVATPATDAGSSSTEEDDRRGETRKD